MSRFTDHLGLELIEKPNGDPDLTDDGRCQWRLTSPLTYDVGAEGSGEVITVPIGATTDLASIPRFAWSIGFPPDGPWLKAAVVHDALYRSCGTLAFFGRTWRTRITPYLRAEADHILYEAMGVLGVGQVERSVIYAGVRLGGARGWGS